MIEEAVQKVKNSPKDVSQQQTQQPTLKAYPYQEVLKHTVQYFGGDELAANVWINKYALKDSQGNIYELTPDDMHRRLARELARIEKKYPNPMSESQIYELLREFKYVIPQGGPMSGIGNNFQIASLSNCFVIGGGEADSYGGIMKTDEEQVQLMKRRGGVGHDLSHIRPSGSPVMNSALTSTGIVPFMERFSNSTREVAQDGRRGALMLTLSIRHPDAEKFIDAKLDGTKVTGANISVRVDDAFMQAAISGTTYRQQFPVESDNPKIVREIDAAALWKKIIHNAWKSAEPGVIFWDTVIRESIPDCYADLGFKTISTNPCGEIPLCPYDSCRLVAINLYSYVENPFTPEASFNFELFRRHVAMAQRIMDDIVDLELEKIQQILDKIDSDPEEEEFKLTERNLWLKIRQKCIEGRRTGLGITAEGDMLAALGLTYGTDKALEFSVQVHKTLALAAYGSSVQMAKERGPFKIFDAQREKNNPFLLRLKNEDKDLYRDMQKYGRRNIALLTIAPTGTTSLMTQTTSGIEPVFMVSYKRRRKVNPNDKNVRVDFVDQVGDAWEEYRVFHHKFITWLEKNNYDPDVVASLDEKELNAIIKKSPYYKATARDVDWVNKVKMQGAIQKWVDHSISVTVNVPEDISEELVAEIYVTGWKSGCKGITVYREGSRSGVLVADTKKEENEFTETRAPKRPRVLEADIVRFMNNNEKWIAVIGLYKGRPYEIFTGKTEDSFLLPNYVTKGWVIKNKNGQGKSRYDFQYEDRDGYKVTIEGLSRSFDKEFWNYAKLISGVLRHGMPLPYVIDMVEHLNLNDASLNTWKNGVVRALKKYLPPDAEPDDKTCPQCGQESLAYSEGCLTCKSCGHSKCS
ncbi:MAG: ribonucleoside-diphosphate reductase, adenosylcobalamin-dependent [Chitinophagales bacterium]|nr:MAG: ribonucleoside-diphosphate reductase, adenosylcobalamin-dependent [Chitinophagales bacterium]